MAKLNARGRYAICEAVLEYDAARLQAIEDKRYPNEPAGTHQPLCTWERVTRRLMSDRTILEKRDVRFQPDWLDKSGRRHSYGWKVSGKLKATLELPDFGRIYREPNKSGQPSRWTVSDLDRSAKTVVLSAARVMRAIREDDTAGFCIECGDQVHGVEPDACGYMCEACHKPAVYGAEEILMQIA
jgi:hypothetical protein